jgi:hypothetical protein
MKNLSTSFPDWWLGVIGRFACSVMVGMAWFGLPSTKICTGRLPSRSLGLAVPSQDFRFKNL